MNEQADQAQALAEKLPPTDEGTQPIFRRDPSVYSKIVVHEPGGRFSLWTIEAVWNHGADRVTCRRGLDEAVEGVLSLSPFEFGIEVKAGDDVLNALLLEAGDGGDVVITSTDDPQDGDEVGDDGTPAGAVASVPKAQPPVDSDPYPNGVPGREPLPRPEVGEAPAEPEPSPPAVEAEVREVEIINPLDAKPVQEAPSEAEVAAPVVAADPYPDGVSEPVAPAGVTPEASPDPVDLKADAPAPDNAPEAGVDTDTGVDISVESFDEGTLVVTMANNTDELVVVYRDVGVPGTVSLEPKSKTTRSYAVQNNGYFAVGGYAGQPLHEVILEVETVETPADEQQ